MDYLAYVAIIWPLVILTITYRRVRAYGLFSDALAAQEMKLARREKAKFLIEDIQSIPVWMTHNTYISRRRFLMRYSLFLNPYVDFPKSVKRYVKGMEWKGYYSPRLTIEKLMFIIRRKPVKRLRSFPPRHTAIGILAHEISFRQCFLDNYLLKSPGKSFTLRPDPFGGVFTKRRNHWWH